MLFAEALLQSVEFWVSVGSLMALILGGAAVVSLADRWRKRQATTTREGIGSLSMYREMYDDGELDEEEYRTIRDRFAAELKGKPATPLPAPVSAPVPAKGAGVAGGANLDGPPEPPSGLPPQAPPIS